jgi:ABC-type nickel/cobalt efflux system permease component RcnA
VRRFALGLALVLVVAGAVPAAAHPLGNFSISHYAGLRVESKAITLNYLIDMAEIPTFQELQAAAIGADPAHPGIPGYLERTADTLEENLMLSLNGQRLRLQATTHEVVFPPGAGGLPTLKLHVVYHATLDGLRLPPVNDLAYRDDNFRDRAGWKEVVATAVDPVTVVRSSVPEQDRSRALNDYPLDLLNSPPQDLEARVTFTVPPPPPVVARPAAPPPPPVRRVFPPVSAPVASSAPPAVVALAPPEPVVGPETTALAAGSQPTPRDAFTALVATGELSAGVVLLALGVALGVGAVHALEPGHGKTVVAAYLVGSRGTAWHAVFLGLVVTASHTAGVYLLGLVVLYASRHMVPERIYPWLGVASGLTILGLGLYLLLQRYAAGAGLHAHDHGDGHGVHHHGPGGHDHHHHPAGDVSLRQLVALGVTGGIVPCPAALVVLLSALALHRIGFGLLLIVAFSLGLASVLIALGLLVVYARWFMARFHGDGPLVTRWLPLTSAAVVAVLGAAIAVQALVAAGIVQVRL